MSSSLLQRTRRARLVVLVGALAATLSYAGWLRLEPVFGGAPFEGRRELAHGIVLERVTTLAPPVTLVVARIPRGAGLRLRARLLSDEQGLAPIGPAAAAAGALVAINGDYHRLDGACFSSTFATLVDGDQAPVIATPFGYGCSFWVDRDGAPGIGRLDLGARLRFPSGQTLPVQKNAETGDDLLISRPPSGAWRADGVEGLPLEQVDATTFRVTGPVTKRFKGPALLRRGGWTDALAADAPAGATLVLERTGADLARIALAIGTGPRLLEGGKVAAVLDDPPTTGWTVRVPRTAVGLTPTHVVLATTFQLPRHGVSLEHLARALASIGCTDAVNLDGGPSTTLWADGKALNLPPEAGDGMVVGSTLQVLPPAAGDAGLR